MGYMVEISEGKVDKMSELAEKMLKYGGKLMQCIEEMSEESGMGQRSGQGGYSGGYGSRYGERESYGSRGSYGNRGGYGMRDDDEWDEMEQMGERRGVRGSGRGRR